MCSFGSFFLTNSPPCCISSAGRMPRYWRSSIVFFIISAFSGVSADTFHRFAVWMVSSRSCSSLNVCSVIGDDVDADADISEYVGDLGGGGVIPRVVSLDSVPTLDLDCGGVQSLDSDFGEYSDVEGDGVLLDALAADGVLFLNVDVHLKVDGVGSTLLETVECSDADVTLGSGGAGGYFIPLDTTTTTTTTTY